MNSSVEQFGLLYLPFELLEMIVRLLPDRDASICRFDTLLLPLRINYSHQLFLFFKACLQEAFKSSQI